MPQAGYGHVYHGWRSNKKRANVAANNNTQLYERMSTRTLIGNNM